MTKQFSPSMSLSPNAASPDTYDLMVHGDIGENWWGESVSAKDVVKQLRALPKSVTALNIRVNSFGGSVADGLAIYNAIREFAGTKTTYVDGVAISAGSLIAMAGDEVVAPETSLIMIHAPWSGAQGNAQEMRKIADVLDKWSEAMITAYTRKSGKSEEEIRGLLTDGEDHWYTATEAQAAGFVDRISTADEDLSSSAKAMATKAPSRIRSMALAAYRSVPKTPHEEAPMTVEVETTVVPDARSEARTDVDVEAAVANAVAAAVAKVEAEAKAKVEAAMAEVASAQAKLALEIEAKEIREVVAEAGTKFSALALGDATSFGTALRALRKTSAEAASVIEDVLARANAALASDAKAQAVPKGHGLDPKAMTTEEKIEKLAAEKMATNPRMSVEQARTLVYTENADLVAALRGEKED